MTSPTGGRVLQIVLQLDPGGTERIVLELVKRLHLRYPMTVCCLDGPGLWAGELQRIGVEIVALNRAPGFRPSLAARVAAIARRTHARVLHCHHYSPFVYGRLASWLAPGTRVVFTEHGRLSDAPPSSRRRRATRLLVTGVSDLYAVSHDLRQHLLAEGFPPRMGVVWNGIDPGPSPDPAARMQVRRDLGLDDHAIVVASIGRLDPVKDFPSLIEGFAVARRADDRLQLLVVGDGAERASLESHALAAGLGGTVRFLGHRDDARRLLAGVDLYANSSISEGVSLTLLEAMAAERPIVATAVGGTPEVIIDGVTGLLVPPRSPRELAARLLALAADSTLAASYGHAGRSRVLEHFTLDRMVDTYARLYDTHRR